MKKIILLLAFSNIAFTQNIKSTKDVEQVLDNLHLYAAEANTKKYIDLFADDAVFFGTDISERWPKVEFSKYATDRMSSGTGWTYFMKERNLYFSNDDKTAWFDEILTNKGYGEFRGTGVLKMVGSQWKIVQYNLLLPIPNNLMKKYAFEIKAFYGQK